MMTNHMLYKVILKKNGIRDVIASTIHKKKERKKIYKKIFKRMDKNGKSQYGY